MIKYIILIFLIIIIGKTFYFVNRREPFYTLDGVMWNQKFPPIHHKTYNDKQKYLDECINNKLHNYPIIIDPDLLEYNFPICNYNLSNCSNIISKNPCPIG